MKPKTTVISTNSLPDVDNKNDLNIDGKCEHTENNEETSGNEIENDVDKSESEKLGDNERTEEVGQQKKDDNIPSEKLSKKKDVTVTENCPEKEVDTIQSEKQSTMEDDRNGEIDANEYDDQEYLSEKTDALKSVILTNNTNGSASEDEDKMETMSNGSG